MEIYFWAQIGNCSSWEHIGILSDTPLVTISISEDAELMSKILRNKLFSSLNHVTPCRQITCVFFQKTNLFFSQKVKFIALKTQSKVGELSHLLVSGNN